MSFSMPIQWYRYHSHADPIWPDGTFYVKNWIRIRIKGKNWIRIRIRVMGMRNPGLKGWLPGAGGPVIVCEAHAGGLLAEADRLAQPLA